MVHRFGGCTVLHRNCGGTYPAQFNNYFYMHRVNAECSEFIDGGIFKNAKHSKANQMLVDFI